MKRKGEKIGEREREDTESIGEKFIVTLKLNIQTKWDATVVFLSVMNFDAEGEYVLKKTSGSVGDSEHLL